MTETARKKASYDDLFSIPENATGEIIDGELIVTPRPAADHAAAALALGAEIVPPYQFGRGGGPGGWILLVEPEVKFGDDLLVPDIAGWRKERFPGRPKENWFPVAPDWVCEILSPGTARKDRVRKMPIYAKHEVSYVWLIDPGPRTLEVFRLESGRWVLLAVFAENDRVRAEPFQEVEMELGNLWID